jgi:hypothetical protein
MNRLVDAILLRARRAGTATAELMWGLRTASRFRRRFPGGRPPFMERRRVRPVRTLASNLRTIVTFDSINGMADIDSHPGGTHRRRAPSPQHTTRMALHAGQASPRDADTERLIASRCCQLRDIGHPSQTLPTRVARDWSFISFRRNRPPTEASAGQRLDLRRWRPASPREPSPVRCRCARSRTLGRLHLA